MAKKVTGYLKLQVAAGSANPSPPIGPALGQRGLNIMEFCKSFNAQTQQMEKGMPIPVVITIFSDKSFTFAMKTPPASYFLKKAAKMGVKRLGCPARRPDLQGHASWDDDFEILDNRVEAGKEIDREARQQLPLRPAACVSAYHDCDPARSQPALD